MWHIWVGYQSLPRLHSTMKEQVVEQKQSFLKGELLPSFKFNWSFRQAVYMTHCTVCLCTVGSVFLRWSVFFSLYRGFWISRQCFPSVWCKCSLTDTTVQCGKASPQLSALKLRNYDNRSSRQHQRAHLLWWWMAPCLTMHCNGAMISKRVTPAASSRSLEDEKRQSDSDLMMILCFRLLTYSHILNLLL